MLYKYASKIDSFAYLNIEIDTPVTPTINTTNTIEGCLKHLPDSICARINNYYDYDNEYYNINNFEQIRGFDIKEFDLDERDQIINHLKDKNLHDVPRRENNYNSSGFEFK